MKRVSSNFYNSSQIHRQNFSIVINKIIILISMCDNMSFIFKILKFNKVIYFFCHLVVKKLFILLNYKKKITMPSSIYTMPLLYLINVQL